MMRDFTYIDDVVEGIIRVLDKPATPQTPESESIASKAQMCIRDSNNIVALNNIVAFNVIMQLC